MGKTIRNERNNFNEHGGRFSAKKNKKNRQELKEYVGDVNAYMIMREDDNI